MTDQPGRVRSHRDGPVTYVKLDRPEKHNALTSEMVSELRSALESADGEPDVRAIIVTGAGEEAFCAGGDLETTMPDIADGGGEGDIMFRERPLSTPLIAAVNGYCIAGGMEFLLATDIRIADEGAMFGLQEPRWGLSPRGGSHVRLPRQIPYCRAMEFLLTGDRFTADVALEAGLINRVVPDGTAFEEAQRVAASICENGPFAVRTIKETVVRTQAMATEAAHELEGRLADDVYAHSQAAEGMAAFAEDRDPAFRREWRPSVGKDF